MRVHAGSAHLLPGEIEECDGLIRRQLRRGSSQPTTGCRQARAQLGDRTLGHAPLLAVVQQRANRQWKQMLADYEPPPIDETVDAELRAFVDDRKNAMPDAWY